MAKGTIGERVYRRLLRLHPRDFSDDCADEMTCLYRDRVRAEGATGVWLALVADLARTAPREQVSTLVQDVLHAWRTWRRTPVLALASILTLALGVGANTAVFSVVHGVLLRPLPYPDADRLVEVFEDNTRAGGGPFFRVSLLNYLSWVERARSFDALAAFNGRDFMVTHAAEVSIAIRVRCCTCPWRNSLRTPFPSSFAQTSNFRRSCRPSVRQSAKSIPLSRSPTCAAWTSGSPKARHSRG
jgi:hypothetical protein